MMIRGGAISVLNLTAGDFQEDAQGDQNQCAQQLVGASEQRPDVGSIQPVSEYSRMTSVTIVEK